MITLSRDGRITGYYVQSVTLASPAADTSSINLGRIFLSERANSKDKEELNRIKSILKLTLGMIDLLLCEDDDALEKAQKKLEEALLELEPELQ